MDLGPDDPCGRAVDILRSCYSTTMMTKVGPIPVRWYFVDRNTPRMPHSRYCSANWDNDNIVPEPPWTGEGEIPGADRPWYDGHGPDDRTGHCPRFSRGVAEGGEGQGGTGGHRLNNAVRVAGGEGAGGLDLHARTASKQSHGGEGEGGTATFAWSSDHISTGGEGEGGGAVHSWHASLYATGGEGEGGRGTHAANAARYATGGEGEGGRSVHVADVRHTATGGEGEGGRSIHVADVRHTATGGQGEGGTARHDYPPDLYGTCADGNVTLTTNTTLTSDRNYRNLTINAGVQLFTNGYSVKVCDTLTNNGTISNSGGSGGNAIGITGGTLGAGAAGHSFGGGQNGAGGGLGGQPTAGTRMGGSTKCATHGRRSREDRVT